MVLVVVGLLISLVGMNIGGGGERRELTEVTRTLYLRMQAAADEAVLTSREIGIRFDEDNRYRFLVLIGMKPNGYRNHPVGCRGADSRSGPHSGLKPRRNPAEGQGSETATPSGFPTLCSSPVAK